MRAWRQFVRLAIGRVRAVLRRLGWLAQNVAGTNAKDPVGSPSRVTSKANFWREFREGKHEADARGGKKL